MRSKLPNCVPFQAGESGMRSDCVAQCEAIYAWEKGKIDVASGMIGRIDTARLMPDLPILVKDAGSDGCPASNHVARFNRAILLGNAKQKTLWLYLCHWSSSTRG